MMEDLHWLRPWWWLALIPLLCIVVWLLRQRDPVNAWEQVVDPELVPYVLEPSKAVAWRWPYWLVAALWVMTVAVLAGPVWEKREMPMFQGQDALVLVLDLSQSMLADDIKPSRLAQAKFKLSDLLDQSEGLQVGLVVFSQVPYVVSPLTDDMETLRAFLPALDTSVVPVQGSTLSLAIEKAANLLSQSQVLSGSIILLTDSTVDRAALDAAQAVAEQGHILSVLGVGSEDGQPIRLEDGSLLQDRNGNIVVPVLQRQGLQQVSSLGGGIYTDISGANTDVTALFSAVRTTSAPGLPSEDKRESEHWIEYGPWLLPLLLPIFLFVFRRGVL